VNRPILITFVMSESRSVSLSAKGLQRLALNEPDDTFTFIVGASQYHCSMLTALFLSPLLSQLQAGDPTIRELSIDVEDSNHHFADVLALGRGAEIHVTEANQLFLRAISRELKNPELAFLSFATLTDDATLISAIAQLHGLAEPPSPTSRDAEYVASHLYALSASDIAGLSFSVLYSILSSPKLVIRNEDHLCQLIRDHFDTCQDSSSFSLLEFVRFEFLSQHMMESIAEWISNSFDFLTFPIWEGICKRFVRSDRLRPPMHRFLAPQAPFGTAPKIDSLILHSAFPDLFAPLRAHVFNLLYRGSRDGFETKDFHRVCDCHSMTLSIVASENGSVFGGYTPLAWHSAGSYVTDNDPVLPSFLFTLKNPHNVEPRIFPLLPEHKDGAIYGHINNSLRFGNCDLSITNPRAGFTTVFGDVYKNDTGLDGPTFFTGGSRFTVQELEVFELHT
jgi:hypothetical protein